MSASDHLHRHLPFLRAAPMLAPVPPATPVTSPSMSLLAGPPSRQETDQLLIQDATEKLRVALRLPATNRRVAHWLFSNKDDACHPDSPLLPPDAFKAGRAVSISHTFSEFNQHPNPFEQTVPHRAYFSAGAPPSVDNTDKANLDLFFVPATTFDGIVVGYYSTLGSPFNHRLAPFEAPMPFSLHKARFAFDPVSKNLICVHNALSPTVTGIVSIDWFARNRRRRFWFTVPNEDYSFEHLPARVLSLLRNVEYNVGNSRHSQTWPRSTGKRCGEVCGTLCNTPGRGSSHETSFWESFLADDDALLGDPSGTLSVGDPLLSGIDGATGSDASSNSRREFLDSLVDSADAVTWLRSVSHPKSERPFEVLGDTLATSPLPSAYNITAKAGDRADVIRAECYSALSGPFNMGPLAEALANLEVLMEGKYFTPTLSRDAMNPFTGEITSRTTCELRASLGASDPMKRKLLAEIAAQSHYASGLAVSTDRLLTFPAHENGNERKLLMGHSEGNRECSQYACAKGELWIQPEPVLAPKPIVPVCLHCQHHTVVSPAVAAPVPAGMDAEARKEAKRRKNRVSAAKSNQRRKDRLQAQEKELKELKKRVQVLQEVENKLQHENAELWKRSGLNW